MFLDNMTTGIVQAFLSTTEQIHAINLIDSLFSNPLSILLESELWFALYSSSKIVFYFKTL